jgi:hypothetical protein
MVDASELDQKYFLDEHVYNCPFCNRRHVSYTIVDTFSFDWTETKKCLVHFAECTSCAKTSMHLSFDENLMAYHIGNWGGKSRYRFNLGDSLDDRFFYSVPTSFFVMDKRVPRILRELLTEAEGCLKSNFLTGASAGARKIIYELAVLQQASGDNYEDRIKSLKRTNRDVDETFFDTLLTIQQVTSSKVHEEAFDGWEAKHLRLILSTLAEVLREIYVVPAVKDQKRQNILKLRDELLGSKEKSASVTDASADTPTPS